MIESFGSTSLVEVGTNYFLYPVGGSSGPELSYSGAPVVAGQFGSWTPLGAEQTASGYEVAWKVTGADQYSVWATDSSGSYTSNIIAGGPWCGYQFCVGNARTQFPPRPQRRRA